MNYSLRIQGDNQFRFWISTLTFAVSSIFVAQEDVSKMLLLILLFVSYSACYGLGHFLSKTNILTGALHYFLTTLDLLAATMIIYLTGGVQSPFFLLYLIIMAVALYDQSLFDFVFDCVLAFLLYGGLLLYETIERDIPIYRMIGQLGVLTILTGFIFTLMYMIHRQEQTQGKLVSRSKTLAHIANTLCGSLSHSKQWIKRVSSLIEEEIREDGLKCRISIHKGNLQFLPPIGARKEINIPIMVGECIFGSMIITHAAQRPLSQTDQDFFSSIAVSLGLTMHRAKLWEEIQEKLGMEKETVEMPGSESGNLQSPPKFIEVVQTDF